MESESGSISILILISGSDSEDFPPILLPNPHCHCSPVQKYLGKGDGPERAPDKMGGGARINGRSYIVGGGLIKEWEVSLYSPIARICWQRISKVGVVVFVGGGWIDDG